MDLKHPLAYFLSTNLSHGRLLCLKGAVGSRAGHRDGVGHSGATVLRRVRIHLHCFEQPSPFALSEIL